MKCSYNQFLLVFVFPHHYFFFFKKTYPSISFKELISYTIIVEHLQQWKHSTDTMTRAQSSSNTSYTFSSSLIMRQPCFQDSHKTGYISLTCIQNQPHFEVRTSCSWTPTLPLNSNGWCRKMYANDSTCWAWYQCDLDLNNFSPFVQCFQMKTTK